MCRSILFTGRHVIPHEQGLDSIKFKKRARNDVEFDNSNVTFVKELRWMKESSDSERLEAGEFLTSGNIGCPECESKIGKWHISPEWDNDDNDNDNNSNNNNDETIYVVVRKRVDVVIGNLDAQTLADYAQEYEGPAKNRQAQNHKKKKQQKKNTKQNNRSNMGNFRNKSFLPNASKQKQQQDDDE